MGRQRKLGWLMVAALLVSSGSVGGADLGQTLGVGYGPGYHSPCGGCFPCLAHGCCELPPKWTYHVWRNYPCERPAWWYYGRARGPAYCP